jgi:hypothetical protein
MSSIYLVTLNVFLIANNSKTVACIGQYDIHVSVSLLSIEATTKILSTNISICDRLSLVWDTLCTTCTCWSWYWILNPNEIVIDFVVSCPILHILIRPWWIVECSICSLMLCKITICIWKHLLWEIGFVKTLKLTLSCTQILKLLESTRLLWLCTILCNFLDDRPLSTLVNQHFLFPLLFVLLNCTLKVSVFNITDLRLPDSRSLIERYIPTSIEAIALKY